MQLPYFDSILALLNRGDAETLTAFGSHVHWGYWDDPDRADGTVADFAAAAACLSRRVVAAAAVRAGQQILDAGCGLGGTLHDLNQRFSGLQLVGLNVDPRQLYWSRERVPPRSGNRLQWVSADACRLPFADASFDVVLAVEAIFHFPDRLCFFQEAQRVLRPGGCLALSDFVPRFIVPFLWDFFEKRFKPKVRRLYGPTDMRATLADYQTLARKTGFTLEHKEDVTPRTLPTFRVLRPLIRRLAPEPAEADHVIARVEWTMRIGLLRYLILTFRA